MRQVARHRFKRDDFKWDDGMGPAWFGCHTKAGRSGAQAMVAHTACAVLGSPPKPFTCQAFGHGRKGIIVGPYMSRPGAHSQGRLSEAPHRFDAGPHPRSHPASARSTLIREEPKKAARWAAFCDGRARGYSESPCR